MTIGLMQEVCGELNARLLSAFQIDDGGGVSKQSTVSPGGNAGMTKKRLSTSWSSCS